MDLPVRCVLILSLFAFLVGGCDLFSNENESAGRIVPGVSVDGVPLGADSLVVRSLLGPPSSAERGVSSIIYRYSHGDYAGFSIHFGLDGNRRFNGTTSFALASPYGGKTSQGVGIATARAAVLDALGEPDFSNSGSSGLIHDRYDTDAARTAFLYDLDARVTSITMSNLQ